MNEETKPNSPPVQTAAPKKTLYPILKMRVSSKTRSRSVQRNGISSRAREVVRAQPEASGSRSNTNGVPNWIVKSFKGPCAPYNDHANWVHDPLNSKFYMIGGVRPFDKNWEPTSDFFCYDTRTMSWEDLTNSLTYREPYGDPYSSAEIHRRCKPVPARSHPGCTLWRLEETSFIFMFGGYDLDKKEPSSQVVIVNLHTREWWYERFGANPIPRIGPAIVAIQNKVYIFGGYRSYEQDPLACYSYSIAEWNATGQGNRWSWAHCDVPYPQPLPPTACVGQAISVYEGKIIFLAPGRTNSKDKRMLEFTDKTLFYFRLRDHAFLPVPIIGDPPRNIQWYSIFDLQSAFNHINQPPLAPSPSSSSSTVVVSPPKKRGRPRKYPLIPPPTMENITPNPSTLSQRPPPSIVICAWLESNETENYNSPEIYRFDFHPEDLCKSLNVKARISSLKRDFQGCAYVTPGHLCLLGNHQPGDSDSEDGMDIGSDDEDDEVRRTPTWNIYLNVPIDA